MPPKQLSKEAAKAQERQAYIESFSRLVCLERTLHPELTRQQAFARMARKEPGMYANFLRATNPHLK